MFQFSEIALSKCIILFLANKHKMSIEFECLLIQYSLIQVYTVWLNLKKTNVESFSVMKNDKRYIKKTIVYCMNYMYSISQKMYTKGEGLLIQCLLNTSKFYDSDWRRHMYNDFEIGKTTKCISRDTLSIVWTSYEYRRNIVWTQITLQ